MSTSRSLPLLFGSVVVLAAAVVAQHRVFERRAAANDAKMAELSAAVDEVGTAVAARPARVEVVHERTLVEPAAKVAVTEASAVSAAGETSAEAAMKARAAAVD